jgi:hypothetical protein
MLSLPMVGPHLEVESPKIFRGKLQPVALPLVEQRIKDFQPSVRGSANPPLLYAPSSKIQSSLHLTPNVASGFLVKSALNR